MACAAGHSFDVSSSGYVNLLQPQDKRSRQPGDSRAAVAARRRLHDLGLTGPLLAGVRDALRAATHDVVLDAGCGDGFYLGSLAAEAGFAACGVDISTPAVEAAAKRFPSVEWVVANADRFVPYGDGAFSRVMSITARMNAAEFRRVLREDGMLLVAVPSPEDLAELRGVGKDRVAGTVATFSALFALDEQKRVTTEADLEAASVEDILLSIYRPLQPAAARAMRVTLSLDLLLFRPSH